MVLREVIYHDLVISQAYDWRGREACTHGLSQLFRNSVLVIDINQDGIRIVKGNFYNQYEYLTTAYVNQHSNITYYLYSRV
jgi:hypothetical protein